MLETKCPLCKQPVSQELFERITGIWKERRAQEQALKEKQKQLIKQQKEATLALEKEKLRLKAEQKTLVEQKVVDQTKRFAGQLKRLEEQKGRIQAQYEKKIAIAVGVAERRARQEANKAVKEQLAESVRKAVEKASAKQSSDLLRAQRTLDSTRKQMSTLQLQGLKQQEKIKNLEIQLKNQTTPQIEGLLYEDSLIEALKKDFPDDKFIHTGKGGDILQEIVYEKESRGLIIYECKKVSHWQSAHLEQAFAARIQRKADYAILVTNVNKKGTAGFFIEKGVLVIHPGGVLALAAILRDQIIRITQLKLTKAQKEEAIQQTLVYLQGAEFKNSLELVVRKTREMYDDLTKECRDHVKGWDKRYQALKSVYIHTSQVHSKTMALISGKGESDEKILTVQPFPALPDLTKL